MLIRENTKLYWNFYPYKIVADKQITKDFYLSACPTDPNECWYQRSAWDTTSFFFTTRQSTDNFISIYKDQIQECYYPVANLEQKYRENANLGYDIECRKSLFHDQFLYRIKIGLDHERHATRDTVQKSFLLCDETRIKENRSTITIFTNKPHDITYLKMGKLAEKIITITKAELIQ